MKPKMSIWMIHGKDYSGFSVRAKDAQSAVMRARRFPGFSRAERPILCVRLFVGPKQS